jgi:hypothetical protein
MHGKSRIFQPVRSAVSRVLLTGFCLLSPLAQAQDEAFLSCAEFSDRTERVLCLEDALEAAVQARDARQAQPATPARVAPAAPPAPAVARTAPQTVQPAPQTSAPAVPAPRATASTATQATEQDDSSLIDDVFGWFGRDRDGDDADAPEIAETMSATVAELELFKPDVWTITLDNGQVWRQIYASRYNLRAGDTVSITRANGRVQYRLEAERFNGFIQVERLR